mmetsp:Transcript_33317/g.55781  ORF Transcript_33317/g.55781 Transcript_33317/m.55781 type:complete len:376 (+) Transcript_33317:439-1566(+)
MTGGIGAADLFCSIFQSCKACVSLSYRVGETCIDFFLDHPALSWSSSRCSMSSILMVFVSCSCLLYASTCLAASSRRSPFSCAISSSKSYRVCSIALRASCHCAISPLMRFFARLRSAASSSSALFVTWSCALSLSTSNRASSISRCCCSNLILKSCSCRFSLSRSDLEVHSSSFACSTCCLAAPASRWARAVAFSHPRFSRRNSCRAAINSCCCCSNSSRTLAIRSRSDFRAWPSSSKWSFSRFILCMCWSSSLFFSSSLAAASLYSCPSISARIFACCTSSFSTSSLSFPRLHSAFSLSKRIWATSKFRRSWATCMAKPSASACLPCTPRSVRTCSAPAADGLTFPENRRPFSGCPVGDVLLSEWDEKLMLWP